MTTIAHKLRHRIDFEQEVTGRDPVTGEMLEDEWIKVWEEVAASVQPLSARDLIAAQSGQSEATARMVIRYRPGVLPTMRIVHRGEIYSIEGPPLPDADSGLDYLTILVSKGVKDG